MHNSGIQQRGTRVWFHGLQKSYLSLHKLDWWRLIAGNARLLMLIYVRPRTSMSSWSSRCSSRNVILVLFFQWNDTLVLFSVFMFNFLLPIAFYTFDNKNNRLKLSLILCTASLDYTLSHDLAHGRYNQDAIDHQRNCRYFAMWLASLWAIGEIIR